MASLRRIPKSPYWIACFRGADGKPRQRSTKVKDRNDALRIALKFEEAGKAARAGLLVEAQARKVIGEIYEIGNQTPLRSISIRDYLLGWIESKNLDAGDKTYQRYRVGVHNFLRSIGESASRNLVHLSPKMISDFRNSRSELVTPGSVNVDLKILRAALNAARKEGLLLSNPCDAVPLLRQDRSVKNLLGDCTKLIQFLLMVFLGFFRLQVFLEFEHEVFGSQAPTLLHRDISSRGNQFATEVTTKVTMCCDVR